METFLLILLVARCFLEPGTEGAIRRRHPTNNGPEENGPAITESIKEVLAQTKGTAVLPCKLTDLSAGTITWVRKKDNQLLTVGTTTHSTDSRFEINPADPERSLRIKWVDYGDAGLYECQISSVPPRHKYVRLNITEAYSVIPGAPDRHIKQGSSLRLDCQLKSSTEPPLYVFWYRNGTMINYNAEPGLKVDLSKTGSTLLINRTKLSHAGNYTCSPSNAKSAYIVVHVIEEEEKPAAMHGGDRHNSSSRASCSLSLLCASLLGLEIFRKRFQFFPTVVT
ncbi:neural cell adhesion molecule 2 [Orussus abietinus]|uniref:neural cell adhesion molecule 2 n=1 Tax=Orussus abietinus TaxID=222816 RepID=UPI0006269C97|nr:neural cell adhesion molecule 2 [Orussus abietinus]